jgi:LysR family nitrogen assimilation transcriptional regulator
MELRQLGYFVEIGRTGSFSRASTSLHVAQPALSRQIGLLEKELGVLLLRRNGRGAVLTSAGEILLSRAVEILRHADEARSQLAGILAAPCSIIRIGVTPAIGRLLSSDLFDDLKAHFPNVSLQISEAWTGHIYNALSDRKVDFGVVTNSQLNGSIFHRTLAIEPIHLIKAHKKFTNRRSLQIRDLAQFPLVLPPRPHGIRLMIDNVFRRHGVRPNVVLESEVWAVIKDVVQKGIACTLFPLREVKLEVTSGLLDNVPILGPRIRNELCLARLSNNSLPPASDLVFDFLVKRFRQMIAQTRG